MMRRRDLMAMLASSGAAQDNERSRRRLGVLASTRQTDPEWQAERASFTNEMRRRSCWPSEQADKQRALPYRSRGIVSPMPLIAGRVLFN
jgi:hypothetical protein